MKFIVLILTVLVTGTALAETPWARDCVTFWGGSIPIDERTEQNCPSGRSHWDAIPTVGSTNSTRLSGDVVSSTSLGTTTPIRYANPQVVTGILMPSGNYVVVPNHSTGGIKAVIQTSKTK